MKATPAIERLESFLKERQELTSEITRIESLNAQAERDREVVVEQAALSDDTEIVRLDQFRDRQEVGARKLVSLNSRFAPLDKKIGEASNEAIREIWNHIEQLKRDAYSEFCRALGPFFADGCCTKKFFSYNPHVGTPVIQSKIVFEGTDVCQRINALANLFNAASPQHAPDPLLRGRCIVNNYPAVPDQWGLVEQQIHSKTAYSEVQRMRTDPQFAEVFFSGKHPDGESSRQAWREANERAFTPAPALEPTPVLSLVAAKFESLLEAVGMTPSSPS